MKKVIHGNILIRAAICGFILAVLFSFTGFSAQCDLLERSVLRLHIPANSDSEKDQAVKLQVRDAVLDEAVMWYGDTKNFDEALALVCTQTGFCRMKTCRTEQRQKSAMRISRPGYMKPVHCPPENTVRYAYHSAKQRGKTGGVFCFRLSVFPVRVK